MKSIKFDFKEEGINRFLGSLEARIMNVFWAFDHPLTIREVNAVLDKESVISFNAVMTVMNRLWEKGYLDKKSEGKGRGKISHFWAKQTKEQFLQEQTKLVTSGLMKDFGDFVVSHMIDSLDDVDPLLLQRLEEKLDDVKKRNTK